MSPTKLVRYTVWTDKKLLAEVKAVSKETRIPAAVLVREALTELVRKYRKTRKKNRA